MFHQARDVGPEQTLMSELGENEKSGVASLKKSVIPRKRVASPDKRVALQDQGIALNANATLLASRRLPCFHAVQMKIGHLITLFAVLPCLKSIRSNCLYQWRELANVLYQCYTRKALDPINLNLFT